MRGQHSKIEDRFDLTLECIRRYYLRKPNPLAEVLVLYKDFFDLFENFRGYTDFFLLQDLVSEDWSAVKFFMRFDDFTPARCLAMPTSIRNTAGTRFGSSRHGIIGCSRTSTRGSKDVRAGLPEWAGVRVPR